MYFSIVKQLTEQEWNKWAQDGGWKDGADMGYGGHAEFAGKWAQVGGIPFDATEEQVKECSKWEREMEDKLGGMLVRGELEEVKGTAWCVVMDRLYDTEDVTVHADKATGYGLVQDGTGIS